MVALPDVGSTWVYPGWTNPAYMGPWKVTAVGPPGDESHSSVHLERIEDGKKHDSPIQFWPGGWTAHEEIER